jgi:hypothetical protein
MLLKNLLIYFKIHIGEIWLKNNLKDKENNRANSACVWRPWHLSLAT